MQPLTASEVRALFPAGTHLHLPDLDFVDWGVLDYLGWIHPSGRLGFAVLPIGHPQTQPQEQQQIGLVLRRALGDPSRRRSQMCSWCHHVYRSQGTAMFNITVAGSDGRRSIGTQICKNLDCSLRIRNLASDPPTYMPETIQLERKMYRLRSAYQAFAYRANQLPA